MTDFLGLDVTLEPSIAAPNLPIVGTQGNPAAGAAVVLTPSATAWTRPLVLTARLVTSAVVATRSPIVEYLLADGEILAYAPSVLTVGASSTYTFTFSSVLPGNDGNGSQVGGYNYQVMHHLWLPPSAQVKIVVLNMDVGDQWSMITYAYEVAQPPSSEVRHRLQPHQAIS